MNHEYLEYGDYSIEPEEDDSESSEDSLNNLDNTNPYMFVLPQLCQVLDIDERNRYTLVNIKDLINRRLNLPSRDVFYGNPDIPQLVAFKRQFGSTLAPHMLSNKLWVAPLPQVSKVKRLFVDSLTKFFWTPADPMKTTALGRKGGIHYQLWHNDMKNLFRT